MQNYYKTYLNSKKSYNCYLPEQDISFANAHDLYCSSKQHRYNTSLYPYIPFVFVRFKGKIPINFTSRYLHEQNSSTFEIQNIYKDIFPKALVILYYLY